MILGYTEALSMLENNEATVVGVVRDSDKPYAILNCHKCHTTHHYYIQSESEALELIDILDCEALLDYVSI